MTVTGQRVVETRFPIMGTDAHVIVVGGEDRLLRQAEFYLGHLEQRWSRFVDGSDIWRLNASAGEWLSVSPETVGLVNKMVWAWEVTGGRFDPTVGAAMVGLGYDRPFPEVTDPGSITAVPGDGCSAIRIEDGRVSIPPGMMLDPGGIGKGLAADLVADAMCSGGATGAMVNIGGDIKVVGSSSSGDAWKIELAATPDTAPVATVILSGPAAVATSTPLRRTWKAGGRVVHHLLDPVTGLPYPTMARMVSVVAADGWWAEASTKQLAGLPPAEAEGLLVEASALIQQHDGAIALLGGMERYLA